MTEWIRDANYGQATQEDYLLGQEIGPNFEQQGTMGQINAVEYDCTPQSIFASRAEHQVDLQRKLQEDPLLALKKRELDSRRAVLDNPIKLKAIQKKIEKMKKSKKKKKSKKRSRSSSSSSSSGSDDDQDLDAILMKKLGVMPENPPATSDPAASSRSPQRHSPSPDSSPDRRKKPTHNIHRRPRSPPARGKPSRSPPTERRNRSPAASRRRRSRSPEPSRRPARSSRERGYRPARSERGPRSISRSPEARKKAQSPVKYRRDRSRSRDRRRSRSPAKRSSHASKSRSKDGDDQARENKLKEMMENAKWREDQRTKNVKHYRSLTAQEETDHFTRHDPDFIRLQLNRAAENATVEKRIRSNRHNIQRSGANMEQNFARR